MTTSLLTIPEVAAILRVSAKTIRRYIDRGVLRAIRLGRGPVRVRRDSVEALIGVDQPTTTGRRRTRAADAELHRAMARMAE